MTIDDYEREVRRKLRESGFNFSKPDPALAWGVFKDSAAEPVECRDSYLLWEAAGDYFDFVREFQHDTEDEAVWHEQVTIHFTCSPPDSLGILPVTVFSRDHPSSEAFFQAVEERPEFLKGLTFGRWGVELRVDSC